MESDINFSPELIASFTSEEKHLLIEQIDQELRAQFAMYKPYPKQMEFHNSTALERVLSGGNQVGKSYAASMELAMHLTGVYPDWFKGEKIKPRKNEQTGQLELNIWVVGTTYNIVRDVLQKNIIGSVDGKFTDGVIPTDSVIKNKMKKMSGVPGFVETAKIRHVDGFESTVQFRAYSQGRNVLQSATIDLIYLDEEPPEEILGELKARLAATGGRMFMAFTPLSGMTRLVQTFWKGDDPDKALFKLSIYESGHMTPEKIRMIEKRYKDMSPNERKARMMGEPAMGTGLVYPYEDQELIGEPPKAGRDLQWLGAIDFGKGEHQNAVVYGCFDEANDIVYITHIIATTNKSREVIASRMKKYNKWCPIAYPHDGGCNSGTSSTTKAFDPTGVGFKIKDLYIQEEINMLHAHATHVEGGFHVEPGLIEIRRRMGEGKLKIAPHLSEWFEEKAIYRYGEDGKPIKVKGADKDNDVMDATRYLIMMLRYAEYSPRIEALYEKRIGKETNDDTNIFE